MVQKKKKIQTLLFVHFEVKTYLLQIFLIFLNWRVLLMISSSPRAQLRYFLNSVLDFWGFQFFRPLASPCADKQMERERGELPGWLAGDYLVFFGGRAVTRRESNNRAVCIGAESIITRSQWKWMEAGVHCPVFKLDKNPIKALLSQRQLNSERPTSQPASQHLQLAS